MTKPDTVKLYMDIHTVGAAIRAAVTPLIAFLGLVHFWIPLALLVFMEVGAAIKVASMIVPCFMVQAPEP